MHRLFISAFALALAALALAQPEDEARLFHTVEAGDTLISIAFAYGVTLDQLLALNDLQPEAFLQIGQRLLVMRAPEFADGALQALPEPAPAPETETAVGDAIESGDLPPAPVIEAKAPMRDPADLSPRLCLAAYEDDNQNGMMDPGEATLADATIRLIDDAGQERLRHTTDGAAEPACQRALERRLYVIEAQAPPGFGLTVSPRLTLDLRAGGLVKLDFGAQRGLTVADLPPPEPSSADEAPASESPRSLLRQLSGLFALGLAAVVFFSGLAVSFFARGR